MPNTDPVSPEQQYRRVAMDTRQEAIVGLVQGRGYISIEAMARRFGVSTQTIRRDIKQLCQWNLLARQHGGASLPPGQDKLAYSNRKVRHAQEKRAIAQLVVAQIPNGASLFIDIGTTVEAVAEALLNHEKLRVITNHLGVASILSERTDFEIILTGGRVRNRDRAVTGEATIEFLQRFKVGYAIFSVGAIDDDGELLDYDYRDVQVFNTVWANSRRRYVVADHSKFNGDAMVRLGHIADIDALFTDAPPPRPIATCLRKHKVRLFIAGSGTGGRNFGRAKGKTVF